MKTLDQYTNEELVALNEEEIQELIELQCAIDGAPLLPPYPVEPTKLEVNLDKMVYNVKADYSVVASCTSKEEAQEIATLINSISRVSLTYLSVGDTSYQKLGVSEPSGATVEEVKILSPNAVAELKPTQAKYERDLKQYKVLDEAYTEAFEAREASEEIVCKALQEAREAEGNKVEAKEKMARYLEMAGGDEAIASQFFTANYSHLVKYL